MAVIGRSVRRPYRLTNGRSAMGGMIFSGVAISRSQFTTT